MTGYFAQKYKSHTEFEFISIGKRFSLFKIPMTFRI